MTAADELRAAATRLRELAAGVASASHTDWGTRPWQVTECADERTDDCPCIVYQGEDAPIEKRQDPPIQYVADAETPEHAAWIATLYPGVGLALADWLEATPFRVHPDPCPCTPGRCTTKAALALARLINAKEAQ